MTTKSCRDCECYKCPSDGHCRTKRCRICKAYDKFTGYCFEQNKYNGKYEAFESSVNGCEFYIGTDGVYEKAPLLDWIPQICNPLADFYNKRAEMEKDRLKYCYKCWKEGVFYIIEKTDIERVDEETMQMNVMLCGLRSPEEIECAKAAGYAIIDVSGWTEEKFKEAGVEV